MESNSQNTKSLHGNNQITEINEVNEDPSKLNGSTVSVGFYSKINCNILKSGINPLFDQYYLCECDPERRNAICFECFKLCHTGPGHRELKKILAAKVCMCGYKAHQPMDEKDDQVNYYNKNCLFGSLGLKYIYDDMTAPGNKICIFCKNLCYKNAKNIKSIKIDSLIINNELNKTKNKTKSKRGSLKTGTLNMNINANLHNNDNDNNIKCNCKNNNHDYIRSLFRKLRGLTKKKNFAEKYEFEGLTLVHVFNLLIRNNECFNNLFYSFTFNLNDIIRKIKENNFYSMEDYKFVNNFHLTCDILSSFAEKNINIYSMSHHLNNQASSPLTKFIMRLNTIDNANNYNYNSGNTLNVNSIKLRSLSYYRNDLSNILTIQKYFKIMMLKFDYKSKNIWQLKFCISNIFYTFTIRKMFLSTINYKIRDMLLLSPLQRLIAVSTNKKKIELSYDKSSEILEMTINLLIKIEKSNEHQNEVFCIYHILYKICQNYAKFGFFTHSQVVHFCSINKKVLLMINESLSEEKHNQSKIVILFKVLSPMLKTLLYLCYHFNDQMLLSYLNKERNINNVNFFHMKNEISKLAMSNVIYAMTIIQELVPEALIDEIKNDYEESSQDELINRRRVVKKTSIVKFKVNTNYFEDACLKRCVRNSVFAAHSTLSLNLDLFDEYQMTMTRLLNSNAEIMINYINGNYTDKELDMISRFNKINDDLEDAFMESFDSYEEFQSDLVYRFNLNLDTIITMINEIKIQEKDDFDENILAKNKSSNMENNKNLENNENNNMTKRKSFNILINFSPLIQTIFKGMHILFYFYTCKKNIKIKSQKNINGNNGNEGMKEFFTLETNIFNKVLEICLYYIEGDINNCFIFLTSDILNIIQLMNSVQLYDFLTIVEKCLNQLKECSEEITSNTYLIYMIKICVIKSRFNLELIHKILKIISIILKLNFSHENNTIKKLKKLIISYYDILKESQVDLQYVFQDKEASDLGGTQNINLIQNGQRTIASEFKKIIKDITFDSEGSTIEKYSIGNSFLIYTKEYSKKHRHKNIYERFIILRTKIVYKILWILNTLFESNANFDEKTFLECILSKQEIKIILQNDLAMDIGVRTELLRFYRIVYLDTVLMKNDVNFYKSLLINEIKVQKTEAKVENQKLLRFYQNLILNEHMRSVESITENSEVIKFELLNYKGIIESLAKNNNNLKTRNYLEIGIIKPLLVYLSKFSGLVFDCSGFDYLRYFELLYHFLFLKKYIIEHPFIFFDRDEEELKDDLSEKSDKKINYFKLSSNKIENKKYRNPFRNKFNSLCKKRKKIIICEFNANELKNVKIEIEKLLKLNFEILNFSLMKNIFESSFAGFIQKERLNKGMKEVFEKSEEIFDDKAIEKKKNYLNKFNLLSTYLQQDIFDIIIHYANAKTQLEESSFLKMLSEDNIFYNCKWRALLIQNILFFMMYPKFEATYKEKCLWQLFSLLEYNTSETQKACLELMERNENPVNFDYFLENISYHIMNVLIPELNPGPANIRHNYFVTLMIIKILKYFCEEHNQKFQRIFFMKEDDGISIRYALPRNPQVTEDNNIIFFDENDEFRNSLISESENKDEEEKKENGKKDNEYFSVFESINIKPNPDIECDDLLENSRKDDKSQEIQSKASVFEYMLSILGKIILISGWNNPKNTTNMDDYLYDLYFVILEFLIETIQGTKTENLDTVFRVDNNGKNLFGTFLNDIQRLIHQDTDEELSYQVRKDMVDFLVTFLEESSTPSNGIIEISTVILPIDILDNIVNIMDKFYNSIKEEKIPNDEIKEVLNNTMANNNNYESVDDTFNEKIIVPQSNNKKLKLNDDLLYNMENYSLYLNKLNFSSHKTNHNHIAQNNNNNQSIINNNINTSTQEDADDANKKKYHFTPKMKKFFTEKFYDDNDFREDIRFQLANRMYQFFKFFGIADEYKNPAVAKFYEKMSFFSERSIIKNYYSSKKHRLSNNQIRLQSTGENDENLKENIATITNPIFYDNYLCVAFFESITRMVFVKKPGIEKPICVLFTVNPVVTLLSTASKNEFLKTVDRSDRYSKLLSLMENCDYFFAEISYKQNQVKNNVIAKYIIDFDFYWFEIISFSITAIINLILIITVDNDERRKGHFKYSGLVNGFGYLNFILNFFVIFIWVIIKFPLYYLTESHKYLKKLKSEKEERNEGDDELNLSLFNKIHIFYLILVKTSTLTGFIWNFIFSCLAVFSKIYFLYIIQILGILNLSRTLKNIILSLVIKFNQLSALFYCILVFNLLFGNISFFEFSRDFIRVIESGEPGSSYYEAAHVENECGTLLYCFATHLSYGMRFDGGIADRMEAASYTYEKQYYIGRFFYEELYFLILVILVLNIIYGVIIDAFIELRNNEKKINRDKEEVCFICGIDKETCQKKGEKLESHLENVHNLWIYVEYMIGLKLVDIQDTNAINSYVIESLEQKELAWFPYDETAMAGEENQEEDEN